MILGSEIGGYPSYCSLDLAQQAFQSIGIGSHRLITCEASNQNLILTATYASSRLVLDCVPALQKNALPEFLS